MSSSTLPLQFHYNVPTFDEYKKNIYNKKDICIKKIAAGITLIVAPIPLAIYRIAKLAFSTLYLLRANAKPLKQAGYNIVRELQSLAGLFWSIFDHPKGAYWRNVANSHLFLYKNAIKPKKPDDLRQLNLLSKNDQWNFEYSNDGFSPLAAAICLGDIKTCGEILDQDVDVNKKIVIVKREDTYETTPLRLAMFLKNKTVIEMMIEKAKLTLNLGDPEWTPLCMAAASGSKEIVELLVEKGAKIDTPSKNGSYPIHFAAEAGHRNLLEYFLGKGQDVNIKGSEGLTPLHFAAGYQYEEIMNFLKESGADENAEDSFGRTASHYLQAEIEALSFFRNEKAILA